MSRTAARTLLAAATALGLVAGSTAVAVASTDSFYTYTDSRPLSSYEPGAVLKTRTLAYHIAAIPTPLRATQLLYRTTDAQGRPSANVTTVVRSPCGNGTKAISYQSFYDSLDPEHGPSRAIAGDVSLGGAIANFESLLMVPVLGLCYDVVLPDTEGQTANFAAGPEYGTNTLDSIRAATRAPETGMSASTKFGLVGYSGGAIATNWAAALAPSYAPDVNANLVGFAEGGVLVAPAHNLKYVGGSINWAGIAPMAIIGVARSYDIDFSPYLNSYGMELFTKLQKASIVNVLLQYPGLTWAQMVKPQYANPNSVPEFVDAVNRINLGLAPTPTIPGYIAQGNAGVFEGTFSNHPGIGTGDGVMVAGDVRALARQYCATGNTAISYDQYDLLSHGTAPLLWAPTAVVWLNDRFAGKPAPSDCGRIPAGNSLAAEVPVAAA
ncbi:lipase family protein [Actinokineospora soli]|uniref:Lipase family protein n=1 Tax=Actinokineospora soli TaxID=1048753 RepID=A0ABW2TXF0_9PSEU